MRQRTLLAGILAGTILTFPSLLHAEEWKPAAGPLITKWGKTVSPEKIATEYPRPQLERKEWLNLDGTWQFTIATQNGMILFGEPLPERILVPFPVESALSGVMKRAERVWYRRTFTVPETWKGKRVRLNFGAVDWEAKVWVNGKEVGTHQGGFDPFSFDISPMLKADGEQEIVVGVFDPTDGGPQPRGKQVNRPEGIYYTPTTGIWQTVWLEPLGDFSIDSLKITPDVAGKKLVIEPKFSGAANETAGLTVRVLDGKTVVAEVTSAAKNRLEIPIPEPKLWSPDRPFLYDLQFTMKLGDTTLDDVKSYCGFREIVVKPDAKGVQRVFLNGEAIFQVGPLDQGFWPDGLFTPPNEEALKFDIEMTKKLGYNMTRKHVKVEPARWYYWCDKLGLLVWQDMPSGDKGVGPGQGEITRSPESAAIYEKELKAMIDHLHNHPSIVMWVIFNEGWGQFDTKRMTEWTERYDPTRIVNHASGWNDMNIGKTQDVHIYPGPGAPKRDPNRASLLGEFGGLGLKVDGHTWQKETWGYRGVNDRDELTRRYEQMLRKGYELRDSEGLCALVYTQLTDVETEANGLYTYDREVLKVDPERVAAANRGDFSRAPKLVQIVPDARTQPAQYRYRFDKPADDWFKADFDDSSWKEGKGGFGTKLTPGAIVGTEWNTKDVWLRREVTLPDPLPKELLLTLHHDEDTEIYLNGVPALKVGGYVGEYQEFAITPQAKAALKPGKNRIAIHCKQTLGGQYVDVGIAEVRPAAKR